MQVAILYGPQEDCIDPKDRHKAPRRHFDLIPEDADVAVIWRTPFGDPDGEGGFDTHIAAQGVFEGVTLDQLGFAEAVLAGQVDADDDVCDIDHQPGDPACDLHHPLR